MLEKSFESTLDNAYVIEDLVLEHARRAGFGGPSLDHISLAVHETAVNAIVHGNGYSPEKKVHVEISTPPHQLRVKIADQGDGFDPDKLPSACAPEDLFRSSGRGVALSRQVMDEYRARLLPKGGTEITLIKYLPRRPGETAGLTESRSPLVA